MPSFYNGKRFFLTYPQCELVPHILVAFLQFSGPVKSYLVAREKHEDGNYHLHACVEFDTVQRKPVDWLDCEGHHPNKQDPRNWNACKQYCKKDGEFIEGPEERVERTPMEICKAYTNQEDWMDYCVLKRIGFQFATWYWHRSHANLTTILEDEHQGNVIERLQELKFDPLLHRALLLKGPTGCGKTTWAKRNVPKPCLFVSHIDQLKEFQPGYHVSIIFDDVDFNHYPITSQIHLCDFDNPRAIHCRHTIASIPAGVWKVFTCNRWPLTEDPAILRRVRRINV